MQIPVLMLQLFLQSCSSTLSLEYYHTTYAFYDIAVSCRYTTIRIIVLVPLYIMHYYLHHLNIISIIALS